MIRISIGRFDFLKAEVVKALLKSANERLAPGIESMKGNRGYFAGIDMERNAMVNVSFWESADAAKQMDSFKPMLDLASEFTNLGVVFERLICNFSPLWTISVDGADN